MIVRREANCSLQSATSFFWRCAAASINSDHADPREKPAKKRKPKQFAFHHIGAIQDDGVENQRVPGGLVFSGDNDRLAFQVLLPANLKINSQKDPNQPDTAAAPRQAATPEKLPTTQRKRQIKRTHKRGPRIKYDGKDTGTEKRQSSLPTL